MRSITDESSVPGYLRFDINAHIEGLSKIIRRCSQNGWSVSLFTMMPDRISRDQRLIHPLVHGPVTRTFIRLITRVVRRPNSRFGMGKKPIPILIGAADLPVPKRRTDKGAGTDPDVDGGLHFHGLLAIPPDSRLRDQSVGEHFTKCDGVYRQGGGIARIHIAPVDPNTIGDVMQYCCKTICRGTLGFDESIVVLPRAPSELSRWRP
ncbi:hypothetical protein ACRAWG_00365 [Methylobacterium sp. P31]